MTSLLHRTIIAASLVSAAGALTLAPNLARANGAGTFAEVTSFGSNPGALKMYLYTPPGISDGAPIVVALHGCTSSATDYRKAGWEELADTYGFWVVYPGQTSSNNPAMCFNWAGDWGNFAGIERGKDENQSIVSMVRSVQADHHADAHRVYVSGHSAGAAMVMVLLATWPDVFDAGAAIAGVPYKCPSSYGDVFTCMTPGKDLDAATWGQRAASGYPGYSGPYPRLSSWHGTSDGIVSPNDQREIVDQWTALTGIDATPDVEDEVDGYPHAEYRDASGKTLVETYKITGAGHATFVDPDAGCGATGGYFADANICSSFHIARFFGLIGGDTGPTAEPDPGGDTAPGPGADTYTPPADTYTPPQN
ncbi:MAG: PHB depolymerase family esterase, partial [Myxococcales bacterium]|nr:PHB depolymerase family esterase [Myxococcales bacterium]